MPYETFVGNFAVAWGRLHEKIAIAEFCELQNVVVEECGLFLDQQFLAGTPDSLNRKKGTVEEKYTSSASRIYSNGSR